MNLQRRLCRMYGSNLYWTYRALCWKIFRSSLKSYPLWVTLLYFLKKHKLKKLLYSFEMFMQTKKQLWNMFGKIKGLGSAILKGRPGREQYGCMWSHSFQVTIGDMCRGGKDMKIIKFMFVLISIITSRSPRHSPGNLFKSNFGRKITIFEKKISIFLGKRKALL